LLAWHPSPTSWRHFVLSMRPPAGPSNSSAHASWRSAGWFGDAVGVSLRAGAGPVLHPSTVPSVTAANRRHSWHRMNVDVTAGFRKL
jgi:hypothetical protein